MGGIGSTRWSGHTPKPLVERTLAFDCLRPSTKPLLRGPAVAGQMDWSWSTLWNTQPEPVLSLRFQLLPAQVDEGEDGERELTRLLVFSRVPGEGERGRQVQGIVLVPRQVGFSLRWYAECPGCERSFRKLYTLSAANPYFRCRWCQGLEYRSTREHDHQRDQLAKALRLLDQGGVASLTKGLGRRPGYHRIVAARRYAEAMRKAFPGEVESGGSERGRSGPEGPLSPR